MPVPLFADPAQWMGLMQGWYQQMPWLDPERQQQLFEEGAALWEDVLAQYGVGREGPTRRPRGRSCRARTAASPTPAWREQPVFALIHQTYLLLAERILEAVDAVEGLDATGARAAALRHPERARRDEPGELPADEPGGARAHHRDPRREPRQGHGAARPRPREGPADPHRRQPVQARREHRQHARQGGARNAAVPADPVLARDRRSARRRRW